MERVLRSAQVLKQEAEDLGYEGKEDLEYVKEQQKLDREKRAAWREGQKMKAQMFEMAKSKQKQSRRGGLMRSVLLRLRLQKNKPR